MLLLDVVYVRCIACTSFSIKVPLYENHGVVISFYNANSYRFPQVEAVLNPVDKREKKVLARNQDKSENYGVCWHNRAGRNLTIIYSMR